MLVRIEPVRIEIVHIRRTARVADTVQKHGKHGQNFGDGTQHAKESLGTGWRVRKVGLSEWAAFRWAREVELR